MYNAPFKEIRIRHQIVVLLIAYEMFLFKQILLFHTQIIPSDDQNLELLNDEVTYNEFQTNTFS